MGLTERLVQGVDLWLNTPLRPWEACGTSGMKVLVNGGLNFSELDGWWAEAYSPDVGWALGDGLEHSNDSDWNRTEAGQLYTLLEEEIVPEFYNRDPTGLPVGWVRRMSESMARLAPRFSANRAVREYTEQHYLPLAKAYLERSRDNGAIGASLLEWQNRVEKHWPRLRFGSLTVATDERGHSFSVQVWLGELDAEAVQVELYADGKDGAPPFRESMQPGRKLVGSGNAHMWTATVPDDRPASDFTPRLVPRHPVAFVPLECANILWYR
jgi:starch phosphorylase